jgi:hypothetical protein
MKVFEKDKPLNGRCDTFKLSHRRGSPQTVARIFINSVYLQQEEEEDNKEERSQSS